MATHLGMIQVSGTTYRIVADSELNHVFRVRDDRRVGAFRHRPSLEINDSAIGAELRQVALVALRAGRLEWRESRAVSSTGAVVLGGLLRLITSTCALLSGLSAASSTAVALRLRKRNLALRSTTSSAGPAQAVHG